ncbi:MAG: ORF6N domain-containing protein [Bacteroidales bacterium]
MELIVQQHIENKIYTIRGIQVMLDTDLALFYEVKPIRLREQMKRNPNRFPSDFVFQLTNEEVDYMVSQNAIPSIQSLGGHLPYVFTEQGVAAVSAVLRSDKAAEVSIVIMRAFVTMRKFLLQNASVFQRLDSMEYKQLKTDEKIEELFNALQTSQPKLDKGIFFEGQVFDAYSFISNLIKTADSEIILIDNFVDESVLTILSKRKSNVDAIIYTKTISKSLQLDLNKYNDQYPAIDIRVFGQSHDRFLLIDKTELYHIGASLKDLGKKWFAFSRMDTLISDILKKL